MSIDHEELTSTGPGGLYDSNGPGFHTCWYPVGLSADLAAGQVRGIDLCDGRIVVFRGDDGVARAMLPYCAHMGADLSVGDVVGNDIRCAFHHWQYGGDGRCTKIATGDRIPGAAVVRTLPLEEHDGLMWVWWGDTPEYSAPSFSSFTGDEWTRRAFEVPLTAEVHVEPWVFAANVMDFQHLKSLHNVDVGSPDVDWNDWGAAMKWSFSRPEVGEINWDIELFGTNSVRSVQPQANGTIIGHIATTVPMGKQGTKVFIVLATNDVDNSTTILDHQAEMHSNIANEDMDVLSTIRIGKANFTSSDKKLVQYMRYQRDYPKVTMAELERGDGGRVDTGVTAPLWSRDVAEETGPSGPVRRYRVRPPSLPAVLAATADRWPDRVHLVQGDDRRTFAQHRLAVHRAADGLRRAGVRPGDRVGILAANSPDWIATLWACWEVGALAAPFNWSWTPEQVRGVIDDCSPTVVVVDREHADHVPAELALAIERLGQAGDDGPEGVAAQQAAVDETAPGLIIYTSGTTGRPKGATFTQGAVIASVQNALAGGWLPDELPDEPPPGVPMPVSLLSYPVFHMAGTMNVLVTTAIGGRLVFAGPRFDAVEILRLIERERVTAWGAVPTMAQRAADAIHAACADASDRPPIDVSSVRAITLGGAPMPTGLPAQLTRCFPSLKGGASNAYGQTEVGGTVTIGAGRAATDPTCVGTSLGVAEIRIDAVADGGSGEVLVRTPSAMLGYWGHAESPVGEDGWVHTGDVGYLDDEGRLHIVDRIKDIIIRGGENISPTAVEEAIATHPAVDEVSVFSVPDPDFGEAIAAVVVTPDASLARVDLEAHVRLTLSKFEVPQHWWIRTEPLGRGTLDKVLRRQLRDEWLAAPTSR